MVEVVPTISLEVGSMLDRVPIAPNLVVVLLLMVDLAMLISMESRLVDSTWVRKSRVSSGVCDGCP